MDSDHCFSLTDTKLPIFAMEYGVGLLPNQEERGRKTGFLSTEGGGCCFHGILSLLCINSVSSFCLSVPRRFSIRQTPVGFLRFRKMRGCPAGYSEERLDLISGNITAIDPLFPPGQLYLRVAQECRRRSTKNGYAEETLTLFCPPVQIVDPMPLFIQGVVHSNSYPYMACE